MRDICFLIARSDRYRIMSQHVCASIGNKQRLHTPPSSDSHDDIIRFSAERDAELQAATVLSLLMEPRNRLYCNNT